MTDSREANLPRWVRDLIADLRRRVQHAVESMSTELARLRPQVELLRKQNDALTELLECAAKGGHATARCIIDIIGDYDLTLTKRGD